MRHRPGFTIIEIAAAIVIAGVVILPLMLFFSNALLRNNAILSPNVALYLAKSKIEQTANLKFFLVASQTQEAFGGSFSDFNSEVEVHYVTAEALNVSVDPTATPYKWITIKVTSDSQPSLLIELETLICDVSNE